MDIREDVSYNQGVSQLTPPTCEVADMKDIQDTVKLVTEAVKNAHKFF